ncbi:MAG: fused MFS/spermidine synthase [Bryobacteraceae bacterium]
MLQITIFLGAFLLFQVQPIVGRYILPWFGGGPAVWTTCMLFFQVLLVGGYAYAHWLGSLRSTRTQGAVHITLLAATLFFLPLDPRGLLSREASSSDPSWRILLVLAASIGGPYLLLSSTGPLLQRWFHLRYPGRPPWRLYSLSNAGSFLALLSYPFAVEPYFRLRTQSWAWSALYILFAIVCGWSAWTLRHTAVPEAAAGEPASRPTAKSILFWIGLAACGSILLLATTNLISQDVAVVPFLWVAPLSVYLLTFVFAFENERWYRRPVFAIAAGILGPAGCAVMAAAIGVPPWWQLAVYLAALFVMCMVCHGELALSRPSAGSLTTFYLAIAVGGALGGVFVALVCPHVFTRFDEYPIGVTGACALGFLGWVRSGALRQWSSGRLALRVPLMALAIGSLTGIATTAESGNQTVVAQSRNFYGVLRVTEREDDLDRRIRELTHGRIRHGYQFLKSPQNKWPTSYFGPHSGIGIVLNELAGARRVGIVGLGAGTLAAWGRPGDTFRFYEINPDVVSVARKWFTYLKDSKAREEMVLGDARVELERELSGPSTPLFDVLAVDAFSGDAIPLHLLTNECADIYRRHLGPDGLLLFHISNNLLRLDPVVRGLARHLGWQAVSFLAPENEEMGESRSLWVLVTANTEFLKRPAIARADSRGGQVIDWTDDFASLWHVLKF